MRRLFLCFLIVTVAYCATYFRLSTTETTLLRVGDSLISTLGYFKATLTSNNCSFAIYSFGSNELYTSVGSFISQDYSSTCQYLNISQGRVNTDDGSIYLYVGASFNISTILTIDDNGVIRLIGTYILPNNVNQVSYELNITTFQTNQTYTYSASQMQVPFSETFSSLTNLNNWQFYASFGQLSISRLQNAGISVNYFYSTFLFNNSQILDFNGDSFPGAIFPNITFSPRCLEPRKYLDFKPPYTFVADPYWPIFTLYEQGRYKVIQVTYSQLLQFQNPHYKRNIGFYNEYSVCPDYTFQYKGTCVPSCPGIYFHEMRGAKGKCVLTCEQYTPQNLTTRVCSCVTSYQSPKLNSNFVAPCPANSTVYPYGCYCNLPGQYFDRLFTFSCVTKCPNKTFSSNGLCMSCPANCDSCDVDQLFRSYLECNKCSINYTLVKGQCSLSCNPYFGMSVIDGQCVPCSDPNCIDCQASAATCSKCNLLYALENGACVNTCPNNTKQITTNFFSTQCLDMDPSCTVVITSHYKSKPFVKCDQCTSGFAYLNTCVNSCPAGYVANSNSYCVCANSSLVTIYDQCLPIAACPIKMYLDSFSQSCLSCPFSCIACQGSACTSCQPGYFLYVSPQAIHCRRKSPLFPCDQQYSMVQGVCLVTNYQNSAFNMISCLSSINNCKVCYMGRNDVCILCNPGFYLLNNLCIANCPQGLMAYENVCVLTEIQNCAVPHLMSLQGPAVLNYTTLTSSNPYQYYIYAGQEAANDPVGYIPYFQQLTKRKNDGQYRQTTFFEPTWTCLKCNDGLGMSDNFTYCLPCPPPCLTCYMAQNYSCLTYLPTPNNTNNTNNTNNNTVPTGCQFYIDSVSGNCVPSCGTNSYPAVIQGILYCEPSASSSVKDYAKIDSAVYLDANGTKTTYFVFGNNLLNSNVTIPVSYKSSLLSLSDSSNSTNSTTTSSTLNASVQNGNFIVLSDSNLSTQAYILQLGNMVSQLQSSGGLYFPNTVYGVTPNLSHPEYMKTWLAIIGEIMSWVLILLHVVFIGNDLMYKVDNVLILAQSIYFFSFVKLLVGSLLAQFYYGWIYAHGGFFPNFFQNTIPYGYYQISAPNSFKLATNDANIIRNAGFTFSLLLVFLACYIVITLLVWIIHKCCNKPQMWYPKIAINSLIAGLQFFSFNIFFWSVAHLLYHQGGQSQNSDFYNTSQSVAVFFIVLIIVYTLIRIFFNPLGGLYMLKRILIASILAPAYNNNLYLIPLVLLELVFIIARFIIQTPERKKEKIYIGAEFLLYLTCYLLMFLCLDSGVNTIIISIIIFVIIVVLGHDLSDVYLESRNQFLDQKDEEEGSNDEMVKAQAENGELAGKFDEKRNSALKQY